MVQNVAKSFRSSSGPDFMAGCRISRTHTRTDGPGLRSSGVWLMAWPFATMTPAGSPLLGYGVDDGTSLPVSLTQHGRRCLNWGFGYFIRPNVQTIVAVR
jgi:hypothetical protein